MNTKHIYKTLLTFLVEPGTSYQHYKRKYRQAYQAEYTHIISSTHLTTQSPFSELVFAYCNDISEIPMCKHCKSNSVSYHKGKKKYLDYCSSMCAIEICRAKSDTTQMKKARKKSMLTRYGVENASHIPAVKEAISANKTQYWADIYKGKNFTANGLTRTQYRHRVQQYAETQYARHKYTIDPNGIRSKDYHLDHIYSVSDGFIHDVPINIISDISNLRLISATENLAKNKSSHKTLEALYEDVIN